MILILTGSVWRKLMLLRNGSGHECWKKEPTNPEAADYKIYARLDAGESLDSIIVNPPTTKYGVVTKESNIRQEYRFWKLWREKAAKR